MANTFLDVDALLPLPATTFYILVALARQGRHGYAVMQEVALRTDGRVRLSAGTVYRALPRMVAQGLLEESPARSVRASDTQRRRCYEITPFGEQVVTADARRMQALVQMARSQGLTVGRT
jgi:DNA-binding PadR family transcriptional regulator